MSDNTGGAPADRTGKAGVLGLSCVAHLLIAMDFTIVFVALPVIGADLGLTDRRLTGRHGDPRARRDVVVERRSMDRVIPTDILQQRPVAFADLMSIFFGAVLWKARCPSARLRSNLSRSPSSTSEDGTLVAAAGPSLATSVHPIGG
jgi:hypothetical protein